MFARETNIFVKCTVLSNIFRKRYSFDKRFHKTFVKTGKICKIEKKVVDTSCSLANVSFVRKTNDTLRNRFLIKLYQFLQSSGIFGPVVPRGQITLEKYNESIFVIMTL